MGFVIEGSHWDRADGKGKKRFCDKHGALCILHGAYSALVLHTKHSTNNHSAHMRQFWVSFLTFS